MRHEWFTAWADQHLGVCILLARAAQLTDDEVFAAFDADPATTQVLSLAQADDDPSTFRVRIGRCDGWLYAVEHFTGRGAGDDVLERLSRACGQAHALWCTPEMAGFHSAGDGRVTTRFDLGMPKYRYGSDPDRYVEEMTRAGLMTAGPMNANGPPRPGSGLQLLESITGLEVRPEMLEAALPSAVLRPPW